MPRGNTTKVYRRTGSVAVCSGRLGKLVGLAQSRKISPVGRILDGGIADAISGVQALSVVVPNQHFAQFEYLVELILNPGLPG